MFPNWPSFLKRLHPEGISGPAAPLYNAVSRADIFRAHYLRVAEDLHHFCTGGRVLDVGTGPGRLLIELHRSMPAARIEGVDISPDMVEIARNNVEKAGLSELIRVKKASAMALPYRENSFDAVLSTGSLHHWHSPSDALNEIHRVLKPDHFALIYDLVKRMPPEVSTAVLKEFGRLHAALLWIHSFEEPFHSPEDLVSLARGTRFGKGEIRFVGALCCLLLRKGSITRR